MNNKIPKIYVNKIDKNIDNNKKVYYSIYDKEETITKEIINPKQIQNYINDLFKSIDFVYKKKFLIKTLPSLSSYPCHEIEQAYLIFSPVQRIQGEKKKNHAEFRFLALCWK